MAMGAWIGRSVQEQGRDPEGVREVQGTGVATEHQGGAGEQRDQARQVGGLGADGRAAARLFDGGGECLFAGADRDQDPTSGRASDRRRDSPPSLGRIALAAPGGARMDDD